MTSPSRAAPAAVVAEFLRAQGYQDQAVDSLIEKSRQRVERTGMTHLRYRQEIAGLTVYGRYAKATLNDQGELLHLIENLAAGGEVLAAAIDAEEALRSAMAANHPGIDFDPIERERTGNQVTFSDDAFFYRAPTVTRVAAALEDGAIEEAFLVETWTADDNLLHHTLIGGDGRVLNIELRTNNDSYNIFPEHPGVDSQTLANGPGAGNAESPDGWLSGSQTTVDISGNNVHAYLDSVPDNQPDPGGTAVTDSQFLTPADLGQDPTVTDNKEAAVQNLFYFNNLIHDKLYRHGFTEAVGNFQEDNFGNGGAGGDSVNAEAQDGSGSDNANFSTPLDGSNPRMQMFLWTQSTPRRDGDLDSDIIWHEYGHGLTWRMINQMSGPLSGAIGEGMSDVLAILSNDNDVVGEYSFNDPIGIRSAPYSNYGRTYGDVTGSSVHFDGEVYAATIWRLWEIFQQEGITQDILFDYLIDGMNFTPAGPTYEDMRDGILDAVALSGSGDDCLIWEAFAAFGIGVGAAGQVFGNSASVTESFELPAECLSTGSIAGNVSDTNGTPIQGASVTADTGESHTTDVNGDYLLANVPVGTRTVSASASGFISQDLETTVAQDVTSTVDFSLGEEPTPATGTIAGNVSDTAGTPIEGASIAADTGESDTTDANGDYLLANVPVGTRTVSASASGFVSQDLDTTVAEDATSTVDFTLDEEPTATTGIVAGVVLDRLTGARLANATVGIDTGDFTMTDGNGFYALPSIPVGDHQIRAFKSGYRSMGKEVTIVAEQPTVTHFPLARQ